MNVETHPDGDWHTSRYPYLDTEIVLKSHKDKGMKAHCFYDGKVVFTQRFRWIIPAKLVIRMKKRVDMWKAGEWIPIKLRKRIII